MKYLRTIGFSLTLASPVLKKVNYSNQLLFHLCFFWGGGGGGGLAAGTRQIEEFSATWLVWLYTFPLIVLVDITSGTCSKVKMPMMQII